MEIVKILIFNFLTYIVKKLKIKFSKNPITNIYIYIYELFYYNNYFYYRL
jgi:hypothetical protein